MSRSGFPKQFLCLTGDDSLFQQAAKRLSVLGEQGDEVMGRDAAPTLDRDGRDAHGEVVRRGAAAGDVTRKDNVILHCASVLLLF